MLLASPAADWVAVAAAAGESRERQWAKTVRAAPTLKGSVATGSGEVWVAPAATGSAVPTAEG